MSRRRDMPANHRGTVAPRVVARPQDLTSSGAHRIVAGPRASGKTRSDRTNARRTHGGSSGRERALEQGMRARWIAALCLGLAACSGAVGDDGSGEGTLTEDTGNGSGDDTGAAGD